MLVSFFPKKHCIVTQIRRYVAYSTTQYKAREIGVNNAILCSAILAKCGIYFTLIELVKTERI